MVERSVASHDDDEEDDQNEEMAFLTPYENKAGSRGSRLLRQREREILQRAQPSAAWEMASEPSNQPQCN